MGVIYTLCFFIICFVSVAQNGVAKLTEPQYQAVLQYQENPVIAVQTIPVNTEAVFPDWKQDDLDNLLALVVPANRNVYRDSARLYDACRTVSSQLLEAELPDMNISALVKNNPAPHLRENLRVYFQNQLFDFYYNNQVTAYLYNKEYTALMKPNAVLKLLKDFKTEEVLYREMQFIIKNSDYLLFGRQ